MGTLAALQPEELRQALRRLYLPRDTLRSLLQGEMAEENQLRGALVRIRMRAGGAALAEVLDVGRSGTGNSSLPQARLMLRVAAPRLNAISGVLKEPSEVSGQERPLTEELDEAAGEVRRGEP